MNIKNIRAHIELCLNLAEDEKDAEFLILHLTNALKSLDDCCDPPKDYYDQTRIIERSKRINS